MIKCKNQIKLKDLIERWVKTFTLGDTDQTSQIEQNLKTCLLLISSILVLSCHPQKSNEAAEFNYGTTHDSARYYFFKGWEEIMDNGRWTESEIAFRKALGYDPNWLLGKSLVGRITTDPDERNAILQELDSLKDRAGEYESWLLEVNLMSIQAASQRDRGLTISEEFRTQRTAIAEQNFGRFIRRFPGDDYFKAEYIEHLHHNHGPQTALDSLNMLASVTQKELPFYLSYAAILELELGNLENARALLKRLETRSDFTSLNSVLMLRAHIYLYQDSIPQARELVDQVIERDSNHLIAKGVRERIGNME